MPTITHIAVWVTDIRRPNFQTLTELAQKNHAQDVDIAYTSTLIDGTTVPFFFANMTDALAFQIDLLTWTRKETPTCSQ